MTGILPTSPNHYQRSSALLKNKEWDIASWLQVLETNLKENSAEALQTRKELLNYQFSDMNDEVRALVDQIRTLASTENKSYDLIQLAQRARELQAQIFEASRDRSKDDTPPLSHGN